MQLSYSSTCIQELRETGSVLQQIDALDPFEDLTELGHHLADLPVEPRYGKMILYSVVLKCLDPILTIACALAYKDPCEYIRNSINLSI